MSKDQDRRDGKWPFGFVAKLKSPSVSMAETCPKLLQDVERGHHENDGKRFASFDAGLDVVPETRG